MNTQQKPKYVIARDIALATAFVLLALPRLASAATCTTTIEAGGNLQTAITNADAGDVLCLEAGTYSPGFTIDVSKSLTIQGPMAGIDPRPGAGTNRNAGDEATEAIIDGSAHSLKIIIQINANDVVLDGLEISTGSGDLIDSPDELGIENTVIRNCIVHDSSGDEGIQLRTVENPIVEKNHVYATAGDGINVCCNSSGATIQYNEVHHIQSTNGGIYTYGNGAGGATFSINDNLLHTIFSCDGVKVGSRDGADALEPGGTVARNRIFNISDDGISIYTSEVLVDANEIYSSNSDNGAIYVTYNVSNVEVVNNLVHDNGSPDGEITYGIRVGKSDLYPANVTVNNNCIENNEGGLFFNYDTTDLDAQSNWWGNPSGPSGAGPGDGDTVSDHVDFSDWLTDVSQCAPDTDGDEDPDQTDCAPDDIDIHAGADELCDTIDNDCDGATDEGDSLDAPVWYVDKDGDEHGDPTIAFSRCTQPLGYVLTNDDCDDDNADIHPGSAELCDGIDNDCNESIDDGVPVDALTWYLDADGDLYGDPATKIQTCSAPADHITNTGDCDDDDDSVNPEANEICNGMDDNCDGNTDDKDEDQDGFLDAACGGDDCDDRDYRVNPDAIEVCRDGYDNDCNGLIDKEDDACKSSSGGCGCSEVGLPVSPTSLLLVIIQLLF